MEAAQTAVNSRLRKDHLLFRTSWLQPILQRYWYIVTFPFFSAVDCTDTCFLHLKATILLEANVNIEKIGSQFCISVLSYHAVGREVPWYVPTVPYGVLHIETYRYQNFKTCATGCRRSNGQRSNGQRPYRTLPFLRVALYVV